VANAKHTVERFIFLLSSSERSDGTFNRASARMKYFELSNETAFYFRRLAANTRKKETEKSVISKE